MPKTRFAHIRSWVFDLDHTLYPPAMRLFDQIEKRITAFAMTAAGVPQHEADRLRAQYWADYGTTLAGLMKHHKIDPDAYLQDVHDISFDVLEPDPAIAARINALPGRKIVYTNGSAPYAADVLKARGLEDAFDAIYGVEHAGYIPKPEETAFRRIFEQDGLDPHEAAMFEDDPRNLAAPHAMGMRTVHVAPEAIPAPFIHHHTANLTDFLSRIKEA